MNSATPDYYQILGLASTTNPEEIKKRYRELARRYHPDVNPDPAASQKIKAVNEAYHTLSDPDRRALYDAHRILSQPAAPRPSGSARSTSPPNGAPGATHRPQSTRPADNPRTAGTGSSRPYTGARAGFNGFGRTPPDDGPKEAPRSASTAQTARKPAGREAPSKGPTVNSLLSEAQLAFVNRRYREAEALCGQALELDRRNGTVYELLGDIYARRGQTESATTAYSYAIQFSPRNYSIHSKLDRIMGRHEGHEAGPTLARPVAVPRPAWGGLADSRRDLTLSLFSVVLLAAFAGMLVWLHYHIGEAVSTLPWLTLLSPNLLLVAVSDGLVAGILLAFYGGMRPISEELVRHETPQKGIAQTHRSGPISLVMLLGLFSIVLFYLSAAVYFGIGMIYGKLSHSLLRAYLTAGVLVALFSFAASDTNPHFSVGSVAAYVGNVLFPALLVGWALGDRIRLRGRRV